MLGTETPIGSIALQLHYNPATISAVTCQAAQATWEMALCSVDSTNGIVYVSALATDGNSGTNELGMLTYTQLPTTETTSQPSRPTEAPFTVQTVAASNIYGDPVPASAIIKMRAPENFLFLPMISK